MPSMRSVRPGIAALAVALLSACQSGFETEATPPTASLFDQMQPLGAKYAESEAPLLSGLQHFNAGEFEAARKYFQSAVERSPADVAAWIGLAASYDKLGRFDLADHAYNQAVGIDGPNVQILNNHGYSRLLRGDLSGAREKFMAAYELDPNHPIVNNNLAILSGAESLNSNPRGDRLLR